ncbi:THAP domain-containing protein 1-like isoform X2 [Myzus persicae]|uniref:THAP domain-containing protein 1-like isoform X2 n=1 Tax=Myzus persicae TaxID=13164 RepID=UPI000B935D8F|nr:THAP domain-containing protein 1-like isoform X2 [Myzus persicae]
MVYSCCVHGCSNRQGKPVDSRKIHFFSFPLKDPKRADKWLLAIGRKGFTTTKFSKVCSDHFVYEDFKSIVGGSYRLNLRENVVPSVFTCTTELMAKRAKLLNITNSDTLKICELEPANLAPLRSPSPANLKEIDTPTTKSTSSVQLLRTPSKERTLLFLPTLKQKLPDTLRKKALHSKIKLLQQTVRRKNIVIKNLRDLIASMKNNGFIDSSFKGGP